MRWHSVSKCRSHLCCLLLANARNQSYSPALHRKVSPLDPSAAPPPVAAPPFPLRPANRSISESREARYAVPYSQARSPAFSPASAHTSSQSVPAIPCARQKCPRHARHWDIPRTCCRDLSTGCTAISSIPPRRRHRQRRKAAPAFSPTRSKTRAPRAPRFRKAAPEISPPAAVSRGDDVGVHTRLRHQVAVRHVHIPRPFFIQNFRALRRRQILWRLAFAFPVSAVVECQHGNSRCGQPRRQPIPTLALLIALVQQQHAWPRLPRREKSRLQLRPVRGRQIHNPRPWRLLCCASRSQHQNPKCPHQSKPHVLDIYPLHTKTSYPAQNHTPLPCFDAPVSPWSGKPSLSVGPLPSDSPLFHATARRKCSSVHTRWRRTYFLLSLRLTT